MKFKTAKEYIEWIDKQSGEVWSNDNDLLSEVMEDYTNMRIKQELSKLHQPTVIKSVCDCERSKNIYMVEVYKCGKCHLKVRT